MEQLMKVCILWEGPHAGTGEEHEDVEAAEPRCYELTVTPVPHHPWVAQVPYSLASPA